MVENASTKVSILNNGRRPLVIRCPGQTVRLAAGEKTDVAESWLRTSELRSLRDSGLVSVIGAALAEPALADGASAAPAEETPIPLPAARGAVRSRAPGSTTAAAYASETPPSSGAPIDDTQKPE